MASRIADIRTLEILDSRGNPTLDVHVTLENGLVGSASVPAGGTPILWWDPPRQDETASATVVPGHSFVVLER